ncbi:MAG: pilus assembly protein, partial [Gammaproteobacteria bacterium]|nr:pilus assembly protein [Gammaproteobacteria bacterium]
LLHDHALLITSCSSIHTFFMQYPIDLAFLNNNWQIKKLVHALKPFRIAWGPGTSMVLEMTAVG